MNQKLIDSVLCLIENCLQFRVECSMDEAKEVLRQMPKYNEIPSNLHEIISEIKNRLGPIDFGSKNPNNGTYGNIRVLIGNEGSLVMYVKSQLFYRRNVDSGPRQKTELESIGEKFGADEVDVKIETLTIDSTMVSVEARFWWD